MLNLKVGDEFQTRGGWKAVVEDIQHDNEFVTHQYRENTALPSNTVRHYQDGKATMHNSEFDVIHEWQKFEAEPLQPTLHDMVAMAAITGICSNGFEGTSYCGIVKAAHEIARAYCATREKEMK